MATVNLDIQIIVIEWVYRSSQHATIDYPTPIDYPTLRACALVCRAWTPIAQRLLFRRLPQFQFNSPGLRLLRTLRATPHLAAYVHSITLTMRPLFTDYKRDGDYEYAVLELCTNIVGITFRPGVLNDLRVAHLQAMSVRPVFLSVLGDVAFVDRIINLWPSVRSVDIVMWRTKNVNVDALRMPRALQTLAAPAAWIVANRRSAPTAEHVAPAMHDLELLLHVNWADAELCATLFQSGMLAQLRTLVVGTRSADVLPPAMLEAAAGLETLVLTRLPKEAYVLPPGLRHLGYHFHGREEEWVSRARLLLDAARAVAGLRLVTATRWSSRAVLEEFEMACRDGGVEFVVYDDPGCFRRPRHVDWI
ncbi:hypothetical protein FA95DRAFT_1566416 [Auriscalpium vulgare]|uniref:Uncharacterized protein n=1 Tax=Auriscalpium vulgare TaxID=40419 RepID=A0ACB8R914_9AGAM|nr:hypothetical protein FA95DRAFT_1566416 [Auriscalpium vulgare]